MSRLEIAPTSAAVAETRPTGPGTEAAAPRPATASRRRFLKRVAAWGAVPVLGAGYATLVEPFWLDVHPVDVFVPDLPTGLDGFRIAHLTDLHAGDPLPLAYLRSAITRTREQRPDAVFVTGDLVTHDARWVDPMAELLATLTDVCPVVACFGNHDYDESVTHPGLGTALAEFMQPRLERRGIRVLRNAATSLTKGGETLWIVGMEDLYTGRFYPYKAYRGVPADAETVVALSHNPDSVQWIGERKPQLVLSGHTHGGQVRIPWVGAPVLSIRNRKYDAGLFDLNWGQLYVSRGVGFLRQVRMFCRPEVPILTLRRAHA